MNLTKHLLRKKLIEDRTALPADYAKMAAQSLKTHVRDYLGDVGGIVVACYMPFRGEIDTIPVVESILNNNGIIAMPSVDRSSKHMIFRQWSPGDPTVRNSHGIEEPVAEARTLVPNILLLPLVGFDEAGFRLGYGGGYYDRALARLRAMPLKLRAVGLAYAMQQVASLPYEAHDARLDAVVTERGAIKF